MRYSNFFGKTEKTTASDAQLKSHKLLVKGGFVRRVSTGRWALLPLGFRVWEKIYKIIDEEMKSINCQKLVVPTLHPIEIWKKTNRDEAFGEEMLVVKDHHGAEFALGATAEGVMLELVKMMSPSYKDLPIELYQFSQKFRDDKRPRGGLVRVREFMMKDAYSFCQTEEDSFRLYKKYKESYLKIAKKLSLDATPVLADSGAIGGNLSEEFIVEGEEGDQTFFVCPACGYAANIEKCELERTELNENEELKKLEIVPQPEWVHTMKDNVKHYGEPLWRYLKNVVYKDEKGKLYIASVRGDQDINEIKLKRALGVDKLIEADEKDLKKIGTKPGYVHSWGEKGIVYIGDLGLEKVKNFIGGQKQKETDSINVNYGRDFKYDKLADITDAKKGDFCPKCKKGKLISKKGFEWGHCFKIDHFYSKAQDGFFINKDGKKKLLWMGSYGIGLERTMALIVESMADEKGIIWPETIAPFRVHLLNIAKEKENISFAEKVYEDLVEKKVEVLYDDRDLSPGEKFADCDLIGCPVRLVVSDKTNGKIEYKERVSNDLKLLSLAEVLEKLG